MAPAVFPQLREDGSFAVAARFRTHSGSAASAVRDQITRWSERKTLVDGVDLRSEFESPVSVSVISEQELDVIFDCRPNARLWKGLMVELIQQIKSTVSDVSYEGVWDLVASIQHPGTLRDEG